MKTSILILCTALITLCVFAFQSPKTGNETSVSTETLNDGSLRINYFRLDQYNDRVGPEPFYKVDSRFLATVTKETLHTATSIREILPTDACKGIDAFLSVSVTVLKAGTEIRETGRGDLLTPAQIRLLQSTDYSNHIHIEASYKSAVNTADSQMNLVYYITVTPERQAVYESGYGQLINYLKKNSEDKVLRLNQDQLKPGKVIFTVGKTGTVSNARLAESSGFPALDKSMLELIQDTPGKWKPAKNAKGEAVEQELVFFFGSEGC